MESNTKFCEYTGCLQAQQGPTPRIELCCPENRGRHKMVSVNPNSTEILYAGIFAGHIEHSAYASIVVERVPPRGAPTQWKPQRTTRLYNRRDMTTSFVPAVEEFHCIPRGYYLWQHDCPHVKHRHQRLWRELRKWHRRRWMIRKSWLDRNTTSSWDWKLFRVDGLLRDFLFPCRRLLIGQC